ncbi:hypothetical protein ABIB26_000783 [Arthrobacter sp. UYEF20]
MSGMKRLEASVCTWLDIGEEGIQTEHFRTKQNPASASR